jgi:Ca2+-binding EF-hand superfamily protein
MSKYNDGKEIKRVFNKIKSKKNKFINKSDLERALKKIKWDGSNATYIMKNVSKDDEQILFPSFKTVLKGNELKWENGKTLQQFYDAYLEYLNGNDQTDKEDQQNNEIETPVIRMRRGTDRESIIRFLQDRLKVRFIH